MKVRTTCAVLAALLYAACGETAADGTTDIQAVQVDGVWLFYHDPDGWDSALHSGTPSIDGGCLFVGDSVVVWHVEQRTASEGALAAAFDGEQPQLLIGGGGISLDEGNIPIPSPIAERCTTRAAWFGSP